MVRGGWRILLGILIGLFWIFFLDVRSYPH